MKSIGPSTTIDRELSNFSCIVVRDNIELNLSQDNTDKISITGGENLLSFITSEVKNDTLYLSNENKCNLFRSYKNHIVANLTFKNIKYIRTYSTQNIQSANTISFDVLKLECFFYNGDVDLDLNGNYFAGIVHAGGANIKATGNVKESYGYHVGTGTIDYLHLNAKNSHLHSRTSADCYLNASNRLQIEIHANGNAFYNTNFQPLLVLKKYGDGQLFPY